MKKAFLFPFLFLTLITAACHKGACIKGIVVDSKTGKPISSASIDLQYDFYELGSLKTSQPSVYSDQSGKFAYTADEKSSNDLHIIYVGGKGYSSTFKAEYGGGKCEDVTVKLTPLDGIVQLTVRNETGAHDSIFVWVFNKCEYRYLFSLGLAFPTQPAPPTLQQGESYISTFRTCVEDTSAVMWRFTKYGPWAGTDSFWVGTADTVFRELKY